MVRLFCCWSVEGFFNRGGDAQELPLCTRMGLQHYANGHAECIKADGQGDGAKPELIAHCGVPQCHAVGIEILRTTIGYLPNERRRDGNKSRAVSEAPAITRSKTGG